MTRHGWTSRRWEVGIVRGEAALSPPKSSSQKYDHEIHHTGKEKDKTYNNFPISSLCAGRVTQGFAQTVIGPAGQMRPISFFEGDYSFRNFLTSSKHLINCSHCEINYSFLFFLYPLRKFVSKNDCMFLH